MQAIGFYPRCAVIYDVLRKIEDARYMGLFFSFRPNILEYIQGGDYSMDDWIRDGKNEYFVLLFRYYTMEELRHVVDINIKDIIKSGDQEIFDLLVKKGYLKEDNMSDLLQLALKYSNIPVVDVLLNKGVKVEPIHFVAAVKSKRIDMMRRMMMFGGDVNLADPEGNTPLSAALTSRKPEVVKELLNYGVDVNAHLNFSDYSPLMLVIERETLRPLVKDFIAAGANVNFRAANDNHTPLTLSFVDDEVRALLLAAGATDEGEALVKSPPRDPFADYVSGWE